MKSGIIIYVAGIAPEDWTEDKEVQIKKEQSNADRVEVITTNTGHFDINDAWWRLIAKGMSNSQIASELVISENTVKGHVSNILSKLHLADRTQAAVFAWQQGIVRRTAGDGI